MVQIQKKYDVRHAAMLSSLSYGMWGARKYDPAASKRIADWAGADTSVGRYNKLLLPEGADSYKIIGAKASAGRKVWYAETLPWSEEGDRVLTSENFMHCSEVVKEAEDEFKGALPRFFQEYPDLKEIARQKLGPLFREEDYPELDALKEKFYMELKFKPMPDAADFRADLPAAAVQSIKAQIEADQKAAIEEAMKEPYKRLWDAVTHMASRLSGQPRCPCSNCITRKHEYRTSEFADTLVDNLRELCDVLPRLNLTGDAQLDNIIGVVKHGLTTFDANHIRNSQDIKDTLAERARSIQEDMNGFMGMEAAA
jgi:hypothetical protein